MRDILLDRRSAVWGLLVVITMLSWTMGHGAAGGVKTRSVLDGAIVLAALGKIYFVVFDFMELRQAPGWMKLTSICWLSLLGLVLNCLL